MILRDVLLREGHVNRIYIWDVQETPERVVEPRNSKRSRSEAQAQQPGVATRSVEEKAMDEYGSLQESAYIASIII